MIGRVPPIQAIDGGGQSRYSLSFDGTDDYVTVPHSASLDLTGDLTIAFWIKAAGFAGGPEVINKGSGSYEVQLDAGGKVTLGKYNVAVMARSTTALSTGVWTHVACVRDGANNRIYCDGVDVTATSSAQTFASNATAVTIGAASGGGSLWLDGLLDDLLVVASALSGAQIAALAAGTLNPATLPCAALWRFEEGSGTTTADSSGNGNTGTLVNSPTWSADVPAALQ